MVIQATVIRGLQPLGKVQKLGKWIPRLLGEADRQQQHNICIQLAIAKGQWVDADVPAQSVPKPDVHLRKVMLLVWWGVRGMYHWGILGGHYHRFGMFAYPHVKLHKTISRSRDDVNGDGILLRICGSWRLGKIDPSPALPHTVPDPSYHVLHITYTYISALSVPTPLSDPSRCPGTHVCAVVRRSHAGTLDSSPVLNRCVPSHVKEVTEAVLSNFYGLLNSWDTIEQILGDLYKTWKEILGLTFLSLVISLLTIGLLHCLAHIVSYFIMIGFTVASIAGTAFLWYTYIDIKYNLDKTPTHRLLSESVRNETAFFWFSIVATIITVRNKWIFLANLFKETSKCLMHIPGLFFQPILTFIILIGFFMFWIFVVLCLATASYPEKIGLPPIGNSVKNPSSEVVNTNLKEINVDTSFTERVKRILKTSKDHE
ncbi:hypothetical protein NQ318_015663 [Aromia moschata]|uniref:Choline transporter-like protein n=1 Tax=Aromia moschata TaxID=1265417 RepID=A0AAV8XQC9_9CUCU|nr:hypothetical protein NQ318_015663 [Aromia moschata]